MITGFLYNWGFTLIIPWISYRKITGVFNSSFFFGLSVSVYVLKSVIEHHISFIATNENHQSEGSLLINVLCKNP